MRLPQKKKPGDPVLAEDWNVLLDKLELIEGPGFRNPVSALRFKRGDAARLEVMFLANGTTPATIGDPATLEIHFGAKLNGQYGTDYIVHSAAWTMPDPEATTPVYSCSPSFNTSALNDALALGGTELSEIGDDHVHRPDQRHLWRGRRRLNGGGRQQHHRIRRPRQRHAGPDVPQPPTLTTCP